MDSSNKYENIVYNLKLGKTNESNDYYITIKSFTENVLIKGKEDLNEIILDFQLFLEKNPTNNIYIGNFYEEHLLEALYLGVLWKIYIKKSVKLDPFNQKILTKLSNLRNSLESKEEIDEIRGLLATKFLYIENDNLNNEEDNLLSKLNYLIKYLEATGDYNQSIKHLKVWNSFLISVNEKKAEKYFNSILKFTKWFEEYGKKELNKFTPNIEIFKENYLIEHFNKEDIIFCGRFELEYHVNLLAGEIMSEIFEKSFKSRDKIAILLPKCMRAINSKKCMALKDNLGFKCVSCNDECNIGEIAKKFSNEDISVYIVSHSSSLLSNLSKKDKKEIGIVGVACINNLIEGGWKITSKRIPPQCVILDYVGCKNHWTPKNIETTLNCDKLNSILLNQ